MALLAGQTSGPVDMSITLPLFTVEASMLATMMASNSLGSALSSRLSSVATQAEQQGVTNTNVLLNQTEQGLLMGVLAPVTCRFSGGLRFRLQNLIVARLTSLGVTEMPA